ncbi:MAG: hypothetical protein AAB353_03970, partial [Candidatus Hydrogenedentota bacterium]
MKTQILVLSLGVFCVCQAALAGTPVTFTENVAPIFMENCVICHRPGEIAPMSLLSYEEARPWAKSIRNKVALHEMPPWDGDPASLPMSNDISLDQKDIDTILAWIDQGAARGPLDKMPKAPKFASDWKMGEPDYVIDMGEFDVAATGDDVFITKAFRLSLPENQWIRAVEVKPGNNKVLHHLVGFKGFFEMGEGTNISEGVQIKPSERRSIDIFSIWAAGSPPAIFPDGTGHPFAKDQLVSFNIHYHPYGEATRDHSKVGIYFGKGELKKEITTGFAMNTGIEIAANEKSEPWRASYVFGNDSRIVSFFPHMHQRGQSMKYDLTTPDGKTRTLLNVPNYDFNWQWHYVLEKALDVPKGSRLDVFATWDNSAEKAGNPDPLQEIVFGEGSNAEMHIGFFEFVPKEGIAARPVATQENVGPLLALHPAEESYRVEIGGGLGKLVWGLHLPKECRGTFYIIE